MDDPSKPLLAVIIDRLSSASAPKAASSGLEGTSTSHPAQNKITKDREEIDAAINDLKRPEDRSRDLMQQARETPTLSQTQLSKSALPDPKTTAPEVKKDAAKMMGAKKETEPVHHQPEKKKPDLSDDSLPGRKFQNIPEDAMKKNKLAAADKDDGSLWLPKTSTTQNWNSLTTVALKSTARESKKTATKSTIW